MSVVSEFQKFNEHVERLKERTNGHDGFEREFSELKSRSTGYKRDAENYSTSQGFLKFNRYKNRYKDILPFDHTRVVLPSVYGNEGSDYINANYIKGNDGGIRYIASQGPLPYTVDDFWRMLWYHKTNAVVMACKLVEAGKQKCQRYWTDVGKEEPFAGLTVTVKTERWINENFAVRKIVAILEGEKHVIQHFHYTAWPDHGVPSSPQSLIEVLDHVHDVKPQEYEPPLVVHCSAGCGRTGVICVVDYVWNLIKQGKYSTIDIFNIVGEMRKQRHAMVQTKEQYEFVYKTVAVLFETKVIKKELHTYVNVEVKDRSSQGHKYENVDLKTNKPKIESAKPQIPPTKPKINEPAVGKLISFDEEETEDKEEEEEYKGDITSSTITATSRTPIQEDMDLLDSILDQYPESKSSRCPLAVPSDFVSTVPSGGNSNSNYKNISVGSKMDDYVITDFGKNLHETNGNLKEDTGGDYVLAAFPQTKPKNSDYVIVEPSLPKPKSSNQSNKPTPPTRTKSVSLPDKPEEQRKSLSTEEGPVLPRKKNAVQKSNSYNYQNIVLPHETLEKESLSNKKQTDDFASSGKVQTCRDSPVISTSNAVLGLSTARERRASNENKIHSPEKTTNVLKPQVPARLNNEGLITKIRIINNISPESEKKNANSVQDIVKTEKVHSCPDFTSTVSPTFQHKTINERKNSSDEDGYSVVHISPKGNHDKQKAANLEERQTGVSAYSSTVIPSHGLWNFQSNNEALKSTSSLEEDGYAVVDKIIKKPPPFRRVSEPTSNEMVPVDAPLYTPVERKFKNRKETKSLGESDDEPPPEVPVKTAGAFICAEQSPPSIPSVQSSEIDPYQSASKAVSMGRFRRGIMQGWNQVKHIGEGLGHNIAGGSQDALSDDVSSDQRQDTKDNFAAVPPLSLTNTQLGFKNYIQKPAGPRCPPAHWPSCNLSVN